LADGLDILIVILGIEKRQLLSGGARVQVNVSTGDTTNEAKITLVEEVQIASHEMGLITIRSAEITGDRFHATKARIGGG
jgi:hypothetical protein